jgi:hypothetical protein
MSPLIVNGKAYIRTQDAASKAGISADYISRLCSDGDVDGKLVEGLWHVNEQSLGEFVARKASEKLERVARQAQHLKGQRRKAEAFARREARRHSLPGAATVVTITILIATSAGALSTAVFSSPLSNLETIARFTKQLPVSAARDIRQLPSTLSAELSQVRTDASATTQLAAATSFSDFATQKLRNFFCWWLECEVTQVAEQPPRQNPNSATSLAQSQNATDFQNVRSAQSDPTTRSATTTSKVVASSASAPAPRLPQPITERIAEAVRTVHSVIDAATLDARLAALDADLSGRMNQLALARAYQTDRTIENIADATRIDSLDGNVITGTISALIDTASAIISSLTATELVATNATTTNLRVTGTASLPTTSVSGDLTVSGTITGGTLAVSGLSSGGAIEAPYFAATSTTATSTFAGGISGPNNFVIQSSSGNVGIGTSSPMSRLNVVGGDIFIDRGFGIRALAGGQERAGFEFLSTNDISVHGQNGSETIRFTDTGEVGIGSTTPWAKLSLTNTGTGPSFLVEDSTSPDTTPFIIDASGNVGVGTASPSVALDVIGSIWAQATSNSLFDLRADTDNNSTDDAYVRFVEGGSIRGTIGYDGSLNGLSIFSGSTTAPPDATHLFINTSGNLGIGTTSPAFKLTVDGGSAGYPLHLSSTNQDTVMRIENAGSGGRIYHIGSTGDASGAGNGFSIYDVTGNAPRFLISPTGNVGIGTTGPEGELEIANNASGAEGATVVLKNNETAVNTAVGLYFVPNTAGLLARSASIKSRQTTSGNYADLGFFTSAGDTPAERLTITAAGNVGIGTTSPIANLSVVQTASCCGPAFNGTAGLVVSGNLNDVDISLQNLASNGRDWRLLSSGGSSGIAQGTFSIFDANSGNARMAISSSGNVGIASTSPWKTLSVVGTMAINGLTLNTGAASASLCLSSTNEVTRNTDNESCITSSARYKHDIQSLIGTTTLETLLALRPVRFEYNETPGVRYGLIAEEVNAIDPTLVGYDDQGKPNSVRYSSVIPLLIQALKDLIHQVRDLATAVSNFAERITTKHVTTSELCVTDGANDNAPVCVTKSQLAALLSQSPAPQVASPSPPNEQPMLEFSTSSDPIVHDLATSTEPTTASSSPAFDAANYDHEPGEVPAPPSEPANDNPVPPTEATGS